MKKIFFFLVAILMCAVIPASGIAPPKKGVKIPAYLQDEFKQIRSEYTTGYWAQEMMRRRNLRESSSSGFSAAAAGTDTARIPIIIGYYSDLGPHITAGQLQQQLYDGPNSTGTVTQFYTENSYGKFYVTGAIADWNSVPNTVVYYAGTDGRSSNGRRDFVIDLLTAADSMFDFSPFVSPASLDGEGYHVGLLGVVHSGAGAEAGAANIWSHKWNIRARLVERKNDLNDTIVIKDRVLSNGHYRTNDFYFGQPVIIDGDYACEPELSGSNNTSGPIIEIGVFCHEFGHIFGLPDLYDTDGSSEGIGQWCLMASGSWGGNGSTPELPTHMSAWCKLQLGWIVPTVVGSYLSQAPLPKVETTPTVFKVWKQGIEGSQYFLVENRQKSGFDQNLLRGGLLIFHVDNAIPNNNDENHFKVDLEQADGLRQLNLGANRGDTGDPFPGANDNHTFDGFSTPNSLDYTSTQTYVGVRNISSSADTMYADFDVGTRPYLRVVAVTQSDSGQLSYNGRIEPDESGQLRVQIQNIHPIDATNAELRIVGSALGATIDTEATIFTMGSLTSGEVITTAHITLESGFIPREVPLTLDIRATGFHETVPVTFTFGYPSLLVVDADSTTQRNIQYYREALDSLNRYYEVIQSSDTNNLYAGFNQRSTIILFSGIKKSEILSNRFLDSINSLIMRGGDVLITGQNIAEDLYQREVPALQNIFHIDWVKNQVLGIYAYGVTSDSIFGSIQTLGLSGYEDGANNQTSRDVLLPDGTSLPIFRFGTSETSPVAGVRVPYVEYGAKLMFLGFGIEGINRTKSSVTRVDVMSRILQWFDNTVEVQESKRDYIVPSRITLYQNFPNPFNPVTHIQYEIPKKSFIILRIYDLLGRKITESVIGLKDKGKYDITLTSNGLSSGTYIYQIQADQVYSSGKMTVLK